MALGGLWLGPFTSCEAGGNDMVYTSMPGAAIPDDVAPGIFDTITVPDSFEVLDIKVALGITHTWVGDLCVTLSKDAGPEMIIMQRINDTTGLVCDAEGCCGCSSDNVDCTLWDGAADAVNDQCGWSGALTGEYYSESFNLSTFVGVDAAGDWTLGVNDNAGGDTGTLDTWSLILEAPATGLTPCEQAYPDQCGCEQPRVKCDVKVLPNAMDYAFDGACGGVCCILIVQWDIIDPSGCEIDVIEQYLDLDCGQIPIENGELLFIECGAEECNWFYFGDLLRIETPNFANLIVLIEDELGQKDLCTEALCYYCCNE